MEPPGRRERVALRLLQLGAAAVVVSATTYKRFELDRFFVPKELVLHLTALLVGLLALRAFRRTPSSRVDLLLGVYFLVSLISAVLATNVWLAGRALAITASGFALFFAARALREVGLDRKLLAGIAFAVVLGALTAALQTYGVESTLFSLNRAPGGTLGNRNFIAHLAAFGLPIVLLVALRAQGRSHFLLAAAGCALVTASLIITRSRAGFLAFAGALLVLFLAMAISPALRADRSILKRLAIVALLSVAAVSAAVFVPNKLRWRSENPYIESIRSVANYQQGSGRGRIIQYRQSLKMALSNPILGVGPGNWSVEYPRFAARRDPSLSLSEAGMTANPWPSSDWIAQVSERGAAATLLLLLVFAAIAFHGFTQLRLALDSAEALTAGAMLAMLTATLTAGLFDAVLLLALPTLLFWSALGALWCRVSRQDRSFSESNRFRLLLAFTLIAGIGALRSTSQLAGMAVYSIRSNVRWLATASLVDPGNYRLHLRLAKSGSGLNRAARCDHARAARRLYPNATEARRLARACN